MRIIQITDLHLPAAGEDSAGIDSWKNLDLILKEAATYTPDLLVFTGDFCLNQSHAVIFQKFAERLNNLDMSMRFIPGNHDAPEHLQKFVIEKRGESNFYPREQRENYTFLYLNSSNAHLPEEEYEVLKKACAVDSRIPLLVFMHHPPVKIGVPHMDRKYAFAEAEKFKNAVSKAKRPVHIFCGHYHNQRTVFCENFIIHSSPSTSFQVEDRTEGYAVMGYEAGMRVIDLFHSELRTFIRYISSDSSMD